MTKQEIKKVKGYFVKLHSYTANPHYVVRYTIFPIVMIITKKAITAKDEDGTAFTFDMAKDNYERFLEIVKNITIQKVTLEDVTLSV